MRNPGPGAIITASSGQPTEVVISITNEAPDPAPFFLEAVGLPSDWISDAGRRKNIASGATSTLKLTINPAVTTPTADYPFRIRVVSRDMVIDPPGERALVLRVESGPASVESVAPSPAVAAPTPVVAPSVESAVAPLTAVPPPVEAPLPPVFQPEPIPPVPIIQTVTAEAAPVVIQPAAPAASQPPPMAVETGLPAAPPAAPVPTMTPPPAPAVSTQPDPTPRSSTPLRPEPAPVGPRPTLPQETPAPPPWSDPTPSASAVPTPSRPAPTPEPPPPSRPTPMPEPPPPTRPAPAPEPPQAPRQAADVLKALGEAQAARQAAEEAADMTPAPPEQEEHGPVVSEEPFLLDPRPGETLTLRPGTTGLVRFTFTNKTAATRAYDLIEDRSLPTDWITLVRPNVNINANGTAEVYARLSPPVGAEPGNYPFMLSVGPRGGAPTPCPLNLYVRPTPAVRLITQKGGSPTVKAGLLAREVVFNLAVESLGNADTAFRIAVKAPEAEQDDPNAVRGPADIDETPPWRYLFDKELETLETRIHGQPPPAQPIHLHVRRLGIWWIGYRAEHRMRVEAIPVTDPANGGKPGNSLELTAIRNRLPFFMHPPLQILLLLLLFILVTSGASDFTVTNGYLAESTYYVFGKPDNPVPVHLRWDAPFYALLTLNSTRDGQQKNEGYHYRAFTDEVSPDTGKFSAEKVYELRGSRKLTVRCLPVVDSERLRLWASDLFHKDIELLEPTEVKTETVGEDKVEVRSRSLESLVVPRADTGKYATLQFQNTSPATGKGGHSIVWYLVSPPDPQLFTVRDAKNEGNLGPDEMEKAPYKIQYKGGGDPNAIYTMTFVTTDGDCQILHVNLKVQ